MLSFNSNLFFPFFFYNFICIAWIPKHCNFILSVFWTLCKWNVFIFCVYSAYFFGIVIHVVSYSCSWHKSQKQYKMDKFYYVNIKNYIYQETLYTVKRQMPNWEYLLHICHINRIYTQFLQSSKKRWKGYVCTIWSTL